MVHPAGRSRSPEVTPLDALDLPVPGLVVLIGAAGAGKSTLADRLFGPDEIVSSDALRAAISGDAADQRATRPAFGRLHREVRSRLGAGRLVVVDATNVERHARGSLLRLAAGAGLASTAIVIAAPPDDVHARNSGRTGRIVPADIVDRHLPALALLGDAPATIAAALRDEGFTAVRVLATPAELDALEVRRVAGQPSVTRPNGRARSSTQTPFRR